MDELAVDSIMAEAYELMTQQAYDDVLARLDEVLPHLQPSGDAISMYYPDAMRMRALILWHHLGAPDRAADCYRQLLVPLQAMVDRGVAHTYTYVDYPQTLIQLGLALAAAGQQAEAAAELVRAQQCWREGSVEESSVMLYRAEVLERAGAAQDVAAALALFRACLGPLIAAAADDAGNAALVERAHGGMQRLSKLS